MDVESFNQEHRPRRAALSMKGRRILMYTISGLLIVPLGLPLLISFTSGGHAKLSTLLGVVGILYAVFGSTAALIGYNSYFRIKKLIQFGQLAFAQVVEISIGGRVNTLRVEFNFDGKTIKADVWIGIKEARNFKPGDPFLIIFDPQKPTRVERFPPPFWQIY